MEVLVVLLVSFVPPGGGLPRKGVETALLLEERGLGALAVMFCSQHRALLRHETRPRGDDARAPARRALDNLPDRALRDRGRDRPAHTPTAGSRASAWCLL